MRCKILAAARTILFKIEPLLALVRANEL